MVEITEDMVGQRLPIFSGIELKAPGKKAKKHQAKVLAAIERAGGIAGIAKSVMDWTRLVDAWKKRAERRR